MIDKIVSVPRDAVRAEIGECDSSELEAVDGALLRWLGMA
jgi:hypothetical protein